MLVSPLLVSGCAEEVVEISLWHQENTDEAIPAFQAIIDEFNESHPNIQVTQQANDWMEAYDKFAAALSADKAPEMVFTIPDYTITMRETGAVQPVDDIVKELDEKHKFFPAMLEPYYYEDHYWSIPAFGMDHGLWYRKDVFEAEGLSAPETWDELATTAKALTKDGNYGIGLAASRHLYCSQHLYDFMITNGAEDLFDADGNVAFNNPKTVETLKLYKELWTCCSPQDSTGWGFAEPVPNFMNGTIAMMPHMGHIILFWEDGTGLPPDQLGWTPIPWPEGGQRGSIAYSNGIMITTEDEKKLEAVKTFLHWLYEPENNGKWLSSLTPGLFLPVTEDAAASDAFWANPVVSTYKSIVEQVIENQKYGKLYGFTGGTPHPKIGVISGEQILAQVVQKLVIDDMSPEDAAAWGQAEMEKAVAD
jgi:multiple sugar transport system substrate-binding protein